MFGKKHKAPQRDEGQDTTTPEARDHQDTEDESKDGEKAARDAAVTTSVAATTASTAF